jgi:Flp pilus assembly protein TadB
MACGQDTTETDKKFPLMSTTKNELRLTDTNAASDSKGRTWGLEGGLFWWLIGGIGAGIIVFFVLLVVLDVSLAMSFVAALVPVLICLAYIFALRQGKPPGYDRDCFEYLTTGRGFGP